MIIRNSMGKLLEPTDLDGFNMVIRSLISIDFTGARKRELDK